MFESYLDHLIEYLSSMNKKEIKAEYLLFRQDPFADYFKFIEFNMPTFPFVEQEERFRSDAEEEFDIAKIALVYKEAFNNAY